MSECNCLAVPEGGHDAGCHLSPPTTPKKANKKRGKGGSEAERIVQAFLELQGWTTHRAAATGFHRFQRKGGGDGFSVKSHDLFGCLDILAFKRGPLFSEETLAVQVTTATNRSHRRPKVERHDWPHSWRVAVAVHAYEARVHFLKFEWLKDGAWTVQSVERIDMKAIKAHWKAKAEAKRAASAAKEKT